MDKTVCNRVIAMFLAVIFTLNIIVFDSSLDIISDGTSLVSIATETTNTDIDSTLQAKELTLPLVTSLWVEKMEKLGWIKVHSTGDGCTSHTEGTWKSTESSAMWETEKTNGLKKLTITGSDTSVDTTLEYSVEYDETLKGSYRKYYVQNANQLIRLLYLYQNEFDDKISYTGTIGNEKSTGTNNGISLNSIQAVDEDLTLGDSNTESGNIFGFNNVGEAEPTITTEPTTVTSETENSEVEESEELNEDVDGVLMAIDGDEDETSTSVLNKVAIVLENDIDINHNTNWAGYKNTNVILEIDGQGHTIYNLNNGYFLKSDQQFYIHDLTFSNVLMRHNYGMFGTKVQRAYFENVNFTKCIAVSSTTATTIVLGTNYVSCYFKECTISNCYVFGNGHCSTFGSFNEDASADFKNSTYLGDTTNENLPRYYTDIPDTFEAIENAWQGGTVTVGEKTYTLTPATSTTNTFPSIYEDCASVDCYVYDIGSHSGTFVSCMRGGIIFKRCFSNSTIMAQEKTGVFLGAVIGSIDGFNYPETTGRVNAYFEDCYTSGLVEGNSEIGGFIGTVFNDISGYNRAYSTATDKGKVIFNNCYSTSLVGLEYSGSAVGGFVGSIRGEGSGKNGTNKCHVFKNCYSAGEVGDISTKLDSTATNTIGGFIGTYDEDNNYAGFDLENCYYDKQTTGMRERDVGSKATNWAKETITTITEAGTVTSTGTGTLKDKVTTKLNLSSRGDGYKSQLTGLYTLTSTIKGVKGLADTTGIMKDSAWTYMDGYYPMIDSLLNFTSSYGNTDREKLYKRCSLASASTVYLDHYDTIMDGNGDIKTATETTDDYKYVYDTVRDITSTFSFTSRNNSDAYTMGVSTAWYLNTTMNNTHQYTQTFGLPYTESSENTITHNENYESDKTYYGYTQDITVNDSETYQYHRDVAVLTITPSTIDTDSKASTIYEKTDPTKVGYIYKCTDFAPGKQWVTVYVADDTYNEWKVLEQQYDDYQTNIKKYRRVLDSYALIIGLDSRTTTDLYADREYEVAILDTIKARLQDQAQKEADLANAPSGIEGYTDYRNYIKDRLLTAVGDDDVKDDLDFNLANVEAINYETTSETILGYCQNYLDKKLQFALKYVTYTLPSTGYGTLSNTTGALMATKGTKDVIITDENGDYVTGDDGYYAYEPKATLNVDEPVEFDSKYYEENLGNWKSNNVVCTRSFRLLPKEYLDAGSDIKITIDENTEEKNGKDVDELSAVSDDKGIENTFTIADIDNNGTSLTMDEFLPNLTVGYASTSNNRLGKYNDSTDGEVTDIRERYSIYGQQIVQTDDEKELEIGVYTIYPFAMQTSLDNNQNVINERYNLKYSGTENKITIGHTSDSFTIAKVYTTTTEGSKIKKGAEVTGKALDEWIDGQFNGQLNDEGYYYMEYYWHLSDGRYLSDNKIVQIVKSSYDVDITSGILNATEEPTNKTDGSAIIDINVNSKSDDELTFPSDTKGFSYDYYTTNDWYTGDHTIENYVNSNDDNTYLAKTVSLHTSKEIVTVSWRRNSDYILKTLNIQVYSKQADGTYGWKTMGSVVYNADGSYIFDRATYSMNFDSIEYIYDKDENTYTTVSTPGVMKEYMVNTKSVDNGSVVSTIDLDFTSVGSGIQATKVKEVRCTAYFVNIIADVQADKYILLDDGAMDAVEDRDEDHNASAYSGTKGSVINVESYREVDDYTSDGKDVSTENQVAVMPGDTLIFRTYLHNDGYYTAQTTNLSETLPSGVHLIDDSIRIYRQYKDTTNTYTYGIIDYYSDGEYLIQNKNVQIENSDGEANIIRTVKSTYKITETVEDDGRTVGRYRLYSMVVTNNTGQEIKSYNEAELHSLMNSTDTTSEEYQELQEYNNGDPTGYDADNQLYSYKVYQEDGETKIDWSIAYVSSDHDYFLEYKAIVDDIGVENTTAQSYESKTDFDNVFLNGNYLPNELTGHLNSNYQKISAIKLVESDDIIGTGSASDDDLVTYTVNADINRDYLTYLKDDTLGGTLQDVYFNVELDNGFNFQSVEIIKNGNTANKTVLTQSDSSKDGYTLTVTKNGSDDSREIKVDGLDIENNSYTLNVVGTQTNIDDGVKHKFILNYNEVTYTEVENDSLTTTVAVSGQTYCIKQGEKYVEQEGLTSLKQGVKYYIKNTVPKENYITYYANVTNTVSTKSAWQYLNLKKVIGSADPDQTFIFKVERYANKDSTSPTDTFYVDIRCNTQDTDGNYYGEQSMVLGKRGIYKVTEVTDWSSTDYEATPTVTVPDIETASVQDGVAVITLPATTSDSTAFKLSETYSQSDTATFKLDTAKISTVTFTNTKKTNQLWKTGQAFAVNSINVANVTDET